MKKEKKRENNAVYSINFVIAVSENERFNEKNEEKQSFENKK